MNILDNILGNTTTTDKQKEIHSGEAFAMWQHLVQRYDIRELTDIFQNFSKDMDFKAILTLGMNTLDDEITIIEDLLNTYGIPLPPRPPKSINTPSNTEILRDEHMFRIIYMGIQNFISQQINTVLQMVNPELREVFVKLSHKELEIYVKMSEYGKFKGWTFIPPMYNPST